MIQLTAEQVAEIEQDLGVLAGVLRLLAKHYPDAKQEALRLGDHAMKTLEILGAAKAAALAASTTTTKD